MAEKEKKPTLTSLSNKSRLMIDGIGSQIDKENSDLDSLVNHTITRTMQKYGDNVEGKPLHYFKELNIHSVFKDMFNAGTGKKKEPKEDPDKMFKRVLGDKDIADISRMLVDNKDRQLTYTNYKMIYNHITEAHVALNIYRDNIMSPDDFTKMIFDVKYDEANSSKIKKLVEKRLDDIVDYYEIGELADEVIGDALLYGDKYVAVLSLEDELSAMMDIKDGMLNESDMKYLGKDYLDHSILSEDVSFTDNEMDALYEMYTDSLSEDDETMTKYKFTSSIKKGISEMVNENLIIGHRNEFLAESYLFNKQEENHRMLNEDGKEITVNDIKSDTEQSKKNKKKHDRKPMNINGSAIRSLDPSKVVELKVDNTVFGYYYFEEDPNNTLDDILGQKNIQSGGRASVISMMNVLNNSKFKEETAGTNNNAIVDMIVRMISKKVDKDFIRKNPQFAEFIHVLLRNEYITKRKVKMTFFPADEVAAFHVKPIYSGIVFFAKLYIAMLTNTMVIKMGRGHDKRIFYVNVGLDAQYEQTTQSLIRDIRSKEFKMSDIEDIQTTLQLSPGKFDDWFMPVINDVRPVDMDIMQGMDAEMSNEFMEFLKNSMLNGMHLPRSFIDQMNEADFARTLSGQNANFVRDVIKYQHSFTKPFTKLLQMLYINEYKFSSDKKSNNENYQIDPNNIKVNFPSPATLVSDTTTQMLNVAQGNIETMLMALLPNADVNEEDAAIRDKLRLNMYKDMVPNIDWDKYTDMMKEAKLEATKERLEKAAGESYDVGQQPIYEE